MAGKGAQTVCIEPNCTRPLVRGSKRCEVCGAYHRGRMKGKKLRERTYTHRVDDREPSPEQLASENIRRRAAIHLARSAPLTAYLRTGQ